MKEQDPDNVEKYEYFLKGALVDSKEEFQRVFADTTHKDNKTSSVLLQQTWSGLNNHYVRNIYDHDIYFNHLTESFNRAIFYALRFFRQMKPSGRDVGGLIERCEKLIGTSKHQRQIKELTKWLDDLRSRKKIYDNFDKSLESDSLSTVRDFVFNQKRKHLTETMSILRAKHVVRKSIFYNVTLGLQEGKNFYGEVTTTFSTQKDENGQTSDLFFDCEIAEIKQITLNGYKYSDSELKCLVKKKFIFLPALLLNWNGKAKNEFTC